jgi:hypothetical protein
MVLLVLLALQQVPLLLVQVSASLQTLCSA